LFVEHLNLPLNFVLLNMLFWMEVLDIQKVFSFPPQGVGSVARAQRTSAGREALHSGFLKFSALSF